MQRISSFKAQYRQAPPRAATPPPPAYEPLSPLLPPAQPAPALPASHARLAPPRGLASGPAPAAAASSEPVRAHLPLPLPRPLPPRPHMATAPAHLAPPAGQRAPKHPYALALDERPAKRARSELYASPQHGQPQSRPATSHIPGWSYSVEHMAASGTRMYHDAHAQQPRGEDRLSDAQLLLDFFTVAAHTAQSPPSTAKRWSLPQGPDAPQPSQPLFEPITPYAAAVPPADPLLSRTQAFADVQRLPELPLPPPDVAESGQTQTPPDESQPVVQETVPAEEAKPRKHQGWPKGKPRGPRSNPSSSKRKRATPKPKSASSGNTSGPQSQLESPQSLPAEQSLAPPTDGPILSQQPVDHMRNPHFHVRRHSFSTTSPPPFSTAFPSTYLRAQSLPLGTPEATPAPANPLRQPTKKAAVEQPDLICAACKSSDSEVKVGDGEQWIGCDGCKEWYHYACAGFSSEREVRDVNKFYCEPCRPKFGETTSRSTDAHWGCSSNLVQRFVNPSEPTQPLTMPA